MLEQLFTFNLAPFWLFLGVVLLIVEATAPLGLFLPFSLACFGVSGCLYGGLLNNWTAMMVAALAAGLGLALVFPCRWVLRRMSDKVKDVNDY